MNRGVELMLQAFGINAEMLQTGLSAIQSLAHYARSIEERLIRIETYLGTMPADNPTNEPTSEHLIYDNRDNNGRNDGAI